MKNFRAVYYEKVGFSSFDVKKCLDNCLDESYIDKAKLSQIVLKYDLPDQYRLTVWKLLLGVDSCDKKAANFVQKQRRETFQVLLRGLQIMRKVDHSTPILMPNCREMWLMFRLERNQLYSSDSREELLGNQNSTSIGTYTVDRTFDLIYNMVALFSEDPVDIYWLCRNISLFLEQKRPFVPSLIHETQVRVAQLNPKLNEHLKNIGFWKSQALVSIFSSLSLLIFNGDVLLRIFDKILAGSVAIEVFLMLECLDYVYEFLMSSENVETDRIINVFRHQLAPMQVVVDKALKNWIQNGSLLNFKISDDENQRRTSISFKK